MNEEQPASPFVEGSSRPPHVTNHYYNGPVNNINQARNANFGVNNGAINYSGGSSSLPPFSPVFDATHTRNRRTSPPDSICLPNTRRKMLDGMIPWALDVTFKDHPEDAEMSNGETEPPSILIPKSCHVLWLCGPVGYGKSAISQTLAQELVRKGVLLGSFFFFKDSTARSTIFGLALTLAAQMRHAIPATAPLVDAKLEIWGLEQMSAADQFRVLIFEPLLALPQPSGPYFAILDGVDECRDHFAIQDLIDHIIDVFEQCPHLPLRFLITSRVEEHIREHIQRPGVHVEDLHFHSSHDDIAVLVHHKLRIVAQQMRVVQAYAEPWPAPRDIERLINHAAGSFTFASRLLDYILEARGSEDNVLTPMERLGFAFEINSLDDLYKAVLRRAQHLPHFREVILTFAIAFDPLCTYDLALLLRVHLFQVINVFLPLQSVFHIPADDRVPIRVSHASVIDFLRDQTRSGSFFSKEDRAACRRRLAHRCLEAVLGPGPSINYATSCWYKHWSRLRHPMRWDLGFLATLVKEKIFEPFFQIAFSIFYHGYYFIDSTHGSANGGGLGCYRYWSADDDVASLMSAANPHFTCGTCTTEASLLFQKTYMKPLPGPDPSMNRCIVMHSIYALFEPSDGRYQVGWVSYALHWWAYHVALAVQTSPNDLDESALLDFLQIPFLPPRYVMEGENMDPDTRPDIYWREVYGSPLIDLNVLSANLGQAVQAIASKFPWLLDLRGDPEDRLQNCLSSMPVFMIRLNHQGLSVLDVLRLFTAMLSGLRLDPNGAGVRFFLPGGIAWSFYLGKGPPDQHLPENDYVWGVTSTHTRGTQETWGCPGGGMTLCDNVSAFGSLTDLALRDIRRLSTPSSTLTVDGVLIPLTEI